MINTSQKNQQLNYFISRGNGKSYEPHRMYKLFSVIASASYFLARSSDLEVNEFILDDPDTMYAAEIFYKKNPCGMLVISDMTDTSNFQPGFTPYQIGSYYMDGITTENLDNIGGKYCFRSSLFSYHPCEDFIEVKQDILSLEKPIELPLFEEKLTEKIRTNYNTRFTVAALL